MSSITLLLLLCLSVHACNARSLGIVLKESNGKQGSFFNKVFSKLFEESKAFLKEEAASKSATSAGDIILPCENDSQRLAKTEVLQSSPARSLLVGYSRGDTDEGLDSKQDDFVEDTVVMDYAQPHRKPPIHNERP